MGADDAVLISDKAFAGSDTWATSYTLAGAIKTLGGLTLYSAASRPSTAIPPRSARALQSICISQVTYVQRVVSVSDKATSGKVL